MQSNLYSPLVNGFNSHYPNGEDVTEDTFIDITKHKSEYALSKLVTEANLRQRYLQGYIPVTILRFGIVYGPRPSNWCAVEGLLNQVRTKEEDYRWSETNRSLFYSCR